MTECVVRFSVIDISNEKLLSALQLLLACSEYVVSAYFVCDTWIDFGCCQ